MKIRLAICGASGRMGQRLVALASRDSAFELTAAIVAPASPHLGKDAGALAGVGDIGLPLMAELPLAAQADAIVDFSQPAGTMAILPTAVARKIPLLVATTGFAEHQKADIRAAAHHTAILLSANTSLVVNVLLELARKAGEMLKDRDFDVEILERHHRFKKDSPSGTALQIAHAIQGAMGDMPLQHGREGVLGERPLQQIGMHAIRVGDNVGEHTVIFGTLGETLELTQRAHTRDAYVRGALQAAKYLANRPAGWYSMNDVLGL